MRPDAKILVTGGCGFIGSAVVRRLLADTAHRVVVADALTYAANPEAIASVASNPRFAFEKIDICHGEELERVFASHAPDAVMHLAAESHVDRSIDRPAAFLTTNVTGTFTLLEAARCYWQRLDPKARAAFRFHHVSTDEVYGALSEADPAFTEASAYRPNSPYSASKAAADHFVRAWGQTYGLPVLISNCSNNYGPWQFPEKLIPVIVTKAIDGKPLPVYGDGGHIRDWLHVEDHARALHLILRRGRPGETYNVGGWAELRNIDLVHRICSLLDERRPKNRPHDRLIRFVPDRLGHDRRYAIDASKIERELGWTPAETAESGVAATIDWYLANETWWRAKTDRRRKEPA